MSTKIEFLHGIPVIIDRDSRDSHLSGICITFKAGTIYENEELNGISHLVEHLVFKGTKRFSTKEISTGIERLGGYFNAYTTKEYTGYYINGFSDNFGMFSRYLLDLCFQPLALQSELEKERAVIESEISSVMDDPDEYLQEEIEKRLFAPHKLPMPIAGSVESVNRITRNDVLSYMNSRYTTDNCIITLSGNVDIDKLNRELEHVALKPGKGFVPVHETPVYNHFNDTISASVEQAYVGLVYPAFNATDDKRIPLNAINLMLGTTMSSRLFLRIREELALCYSIDSDMSLFEDRGYFAIYYSCKPELMERVQDEITKEIQAILLDGFTADELEMAINQLRYSVLSGYDSIENRMFIHQKSWLYHGEAFILQDAMRRIDELTIESVNSVFAEIFSGECSVCRLIP